MNLITLIATMPVTSGFAGAAYLTLVTLAVWPDARRKVGGWLVLPPPSNQAHLAPLDALRGISALWVASFHFWQWPQPFLNATLMVAPFVAMGEKAVPVFVALSGFLIYRAARPIATTAQFRRYLRSRFLRVYPLYCAAVVVALLAGQFRSDVPVTQSLLAELFMVRAIGFPGFVVPPIWSLYVEVLFYLLLPAFVVIAGARPIAAASIAFVVLALSHPLGPRELDLWQFFCIGVITSELQQRYQGRLPEPLPSLLFICGLGMFVADLCFATMNNFDLIGYGLHVLAPYLRLAGAYPNYTLDLALAIALLILGSTWSRAISGFFAYYPWRFLAVVSYSVFVWHGFLIIADFPIAFDGTGGIRFLAAMPQAGPAWTMPLIVWPALLMAGALSYALIERPFLLLRRSTVIARPHAREDAAPASRRSAG